MSTGGDAARSDLRGGAGWILFGLLILVLSARMDRFEAMGATIYTAPGFVPAIFGATLVLLGSVLALRGWRARHAGAGDAAEPLLNRRVLLMLALTLVYAAGLVGRLPFWLGTFLFVGSFTWLYADETPPPRRAAVALASGLLTALIVVLVFERIFLVRLP